MTTSAARWALAALTSALVAAGCSSDTNAASPTTADASASTETSDLPAGAEDLVGRYAHYDVVAYEDEAMKVLIISTGFADLETRDGQLWNAMTFCHADVSSDQGLEITISDAATRAILPIDTPVEVTDVDGKLHVVRPATPTAIGIRIEDPATERLPTDPDDPRIFDADGDGNPGVTSSVKVGDALQGDIYLARREIFAYDLTQESPDRLVGSITDRSEQLILGASNPAFLSTAQWKQIDDPERNPVIWSRVDSDWDCERLAAEREQDLPAAAPSRLVIQPARRTFRLVGNAAVAVALVMTAAGCGSDDEDSAPTTSVSVTTTASAPSPACRGDGRTAPVERLDVTVDGTPRTALVHLPSNAVGSDPRPVVLSFHGVSGSASLQRATDGLSDKADEEGFVAVHPEGLLVGLNDQVNGTSGWDPDGSEVDEPAFIAALIGELGAQVCIDLSRVYATGFSAGAHNALTIVCALPDHIAAVATVSAAYQSTACSSGRAMPTLAFHGLDDIVTPFEGRRTAEAGTLVPVLDALDAQASRNGCTDGADTETVTANVESLTWAGCAAPTVLYQLRDHGHAWPGHPLPFTADVLARVLAGSAGQPPDPLAIAIGQTPDAMAQNVLLTNVDIDATDLIWDFFAANR